MFAASKSGQAAAAAPSSDPNFPYVPLLLDTTTTNGQQNNTFLDSSTNNFTITRNGTPTQGSVTPYWPNGYWSNYFGGSGDCLTWPSNAAFTLGTGDFTIEAWIFPNSASGVQGVLGLADGGSTGSCTFFYNLTANKVTLNSYLGTTATSTASISANTWTHVAFSRASGSLKTFINGALDNTVAFTDNLTKTAFVVGRSYSTLNQEYFPGYISNVRVVKGTAVYTAAFTPSTTPLTAITNTSVLTCQSNRFRDNSANNFTATSNGTPRVQAFQPFSPAASYTPAAYGGSGYNGTKTDYLSIANTAAVTTYTGDFTMECWVNPTDTSLSASWGIMDTRTSGGTATSWIWSLANYTSAGWIVQMYAGAAFNFTLRVPPYVWSHVVLQRNGGTLRCFVNGVVDSTALSFAGTLAGGSGAITIANTKDSGLAPYGNIGYISNLRIVNGTAVYSTSGFTPPTAPVTAITNTSLLLNYTNAGIYDAAAQNNQITVSTAQTSITQYKWSPTSMRFNGTTDYLSMASNPAFAFGTGNFTLECWIYATAASDSAIYEGRTLGSGTAGFTLTAFSSSVIRVYTGTSAIISSSGTTYLNQWTYVAVVRSAGTTTLYINGTSVGTSASMGNLTESSPLVGAGRYTGLSTPSSFFNGYIQDFRLTKGVARTITTPTAAFPTR